jgi:hypothetical protein
MGLAQWSPLTVVSHTTRPPVARALGCRRHDHWVADRVASLFGEGWLIGTKRVGIHRAHAQGMTGPRGEAVTTSTRSSGAPYYWRGKSLWRSPSFLAAVGNKRTPVLDRVVWSVGATAGYRRG